MRTLILILLCFNLSAQKDYDKHYIVSVNLSSFVGSSAYYFTKKPLISGLIGIGTSFLVGMGKEYIWDEKLGKGTKSGLDLDADLRGSLAGGLITFGVTDCIRKKKEKIDTEYYNFN